MRRCNSLILNNPEYLQEYLRLHSERVFKEVLKAHPEPCCDLFLRSLWFFRRGLKTFVQALKRLLSEACFRERV